MGIRARVRACARRDARARVYPSCSRVRSREKSTGLSTVASTAASAAARAPRPHHSVSAAALFSSFGFSSRARSVVTSRSRAARGSSAPRGAAAP